VAEKTYGELLKDPRWQRKRLEVMQRDAWSCQNCGDKTTNLQVHHRRYDRGKKPWEYGDDVLVTLCENCHVREGFRLISIDLDEDSAARDHDEEWSVWFRVNEGILQLGSENGCYSWSEPDQRKPNARVSRFCVPGRDEKRGALSWEERRSLVRAAIEELISNFGGR
jgi:hypothetical protein